MVHDFPEAVLRPVIKIPDQVELDKFSALDNLLELDLFLCIQLSLVGQAGIKGANDYHIYPGHPFCGS